MSGRHRDEQIGVQAAQVSFQLMDDRVEMPVPQKLLIGIERRESLLDEQLLLTQGYFYPGPIRNLWAEHKSGRRDHTASLWTVLMFQSWLQEHAHGVPACSLTG